MPSILAGQTSTFTIPQGQVAQITGDGIAILIYPVSSPISISGQATLGPYAFPRIVSLQALQPINYTVDFPSTGTGGGGSIGLLGLVSRPVISSSAVAGSSIGATNAIFVGIPAPSTAVQWLRDGVAISGATSIPYASISSDAGKTLTLRATATNSAGTLTATSDPVVVAAAAGGGGITITTFPYTLQASDSGKVLNLQPSGTAEAKVIYPTSLGASFSCTLSQPSSVANPIAVEEATGVVGKNTNGLFISSSTGVQAKGLGSPMLRGPGANVTVSATAADQFTLGGDVGKWQHIAHHTNFPTAYSSAVRQMMGASLHKLPGGKPGTVFTAIRLVYTNCYGVGETVASGDISITAALEYPVGASTTPIQATFAGQATATLTGGVKTRLVSDIIYPATPIPVDSFVRIRTWQGGATGIVTNTGRDRQDYWTYNTTIGTDLDRTMQLYSTYPALSYTLHGTGIGSPQSLRPTAIIGVTDTGAIILIGTSRDVASNGDFPTVGGSGMQGEGERVIGRRGAVLNLAAATESMNGAWLGGNVGGSTMRRSMMEWGGTIYNGHGVNDLNGGTSAQIASFYTSMYNTSINDFAGRNMYVITTPPSLVSTTDYFTSTAGQTFSNPTNEGRRTGLNDLVRAGGLSKVTGYIEVADTVETARNSGILKVNPRARVLTDATISAGSNVLTSPSGAFTTADSGCYISLPMGASGAIVHATMQYVSATTVNLVSYVGLANFNAATAVAAGQNVYVCSLEVMQADGNHEMQRGGNMIESLVTVPTIAAIGPIN